MLLTTLDHFEQTLVYFSSQKPERLTLKESYKFTSRNRNVSIFFSVIFLTGILSSHSLALPPSVHFGLRHNSLPYISGGSQTSQPSHSYHSKVFFHIINPSVSFLAFHVASYTWDPLKRSSFLSQIIGPLYVFYLSHSLSLIKLIMFSHL